jgi:hypothetical protein
MTTSQKNAIYYNYRNEEGIIRTSICQALGLCSLFCRSKYVYLSNFLKYQYGITVSYHTIFCSQHIAFMLAQSLPAYLPKIYKFKVI